MMSLPDTYVWLVWSSAFLLPWAVLFAAFPQYRRVMLWASIFTTPFGLTEPLFVPEYWSPPSLWNLARSTGFDVESLIFCFGIGGVGAVLYNVLTGRRLEPLPQSVREAPDHRFHRAALSVPLVAFPPLWLLPWNPIYPAILALVAGALATVACRRDLKWNVLFGGGIFVVYYTVFLFGLEATASGYIGRVWNLDALSGLSVLGFPVEELLFAFSFGTYWAGVYEHFAWRRSTRGRTAEDSEGPSPATAAAGSPRAEGASGEMPAHQ